MTGNTLATALVLTMHFVPTLLDAQVVPGFDTGLYSHHVWRGITRRNAWVWQSDIFVGYGIDRVFLTAGGWANFELTRADPRIEEAIGLGNRVGELDAWLEASYQSEVLELAAGYTAYRFTDVEDAARVGSVVFDTEEAYIRLVGRVGGFSPKAAIWYDFRVAKGAYSELGLTYDFPVLPYGIQVLRLGSSTGISLGQEVNDRDPNEPAYFDDAGITHWDLFTEAQLSLEITGFNLYALPAIHVQFNVDDATRRTDRTLDGANTGAKVWGGVVVTWYLGR